MEIIFSILLELKHASEREFPICIICIHIYSVDNDIAKNWPSRILMDVDFKASEVNVKHMKVGFFKSTESQTSIDLR